MTAWTQRPEDEHRLLSSLLACFLRNPMLKPGDLGGLARRRRTCPVYIDVGQPPTQDRSLADVWSALGGELKPSLDVVVTAPIVVSRALRRSGRRSSRGRRSGSRRRWAPGGATGCGATRRPCRAAARAAARGDRPGAAPMRVVPASPCGCAASGPVTAATPREPAAAPRQCPVTRVPGEDDPSLAYLFARLALVEARVRAAVDRRRADDPDPDDRFRGLYISDAQVDALLAGPPGTLVRAPADDALRPARRRRWTARPTRPRPPAPTSGSVELARAFGLDARGRRAAPGRARPGPGPAVRAPLRLPPRRRVAPPRASAGLALELAGGPGAPIRARRAAAGPARAALRRTGRACCSVEDPDRPFLTRSLRVPDRVAAHLLGDDGPDPVVDALLVDSIAVERAGR